VRGMGERYNSTEVDGVRVVSPEQNKRVVPMDLFPTALLDNIVVQKAWSADRSGEFSGGDVQVHLKDFPGRRSWSASVTQGVADGTTFHDHLSYAAGRGDLFGFGAGAREIPGVAARPARGRTLPAGVFRDVWSPVGVRTVPNGSYSLTAGDEFRVFGHPLGTIESVTLSRSFDQRSEVQRFSDDGVVAKSAYDIRRSTESVQLGGNASLSYRPSPGQVLSARGLYTNKADDEVLTYSGPDPNDGAFDRRATRLTYVQRAIGYATLEGRHELDPLGHASLDWKFTRSDARRQQPDKRESMYIRVPIDETNPGTWGLATGRREFGDLRENGWGTSVKLSLPYRAAALGSGRLFTGYDRESRRRNNAYRRFDFAPSQPGQDAPPESLYVAGATETTDPRDNYVADQLVEAWFLSADLPFGRRLRGNAGVRHEFGAQNVASHDLFSPRIVVSQGHARGSDWLAGANLTFAWTEKLNLRASASRTLNRPDLDDLSPLPALDFVGDKIRIGNPLLKRATISNYDVRIEAFPSLNEVFAAGVFYKNLRHPIEPALFGTNGQLGIRPENSEGGRNLGLEIEARAGLRRIAPRLRQLAINSNLSVISSQIRARQATNRGNTVHPLVGQAPFLLNLGVTWTSRSGRSEVSCLASTVGRRLKELNQTFVNGPADGIPNLESPALTTLDATASFAGVRGSRIKVAAGNLWNRAVRETEGPVEMRRYSTGRTYSLALSWGQ